MKAWQPQYMSDFKAGLKQFLGEEVEVSRVPGCMVQVKPAVAPPALVSMDGLLRSRDVRELAYEVALEIRMGQEQRQRRIIQMAPFETFNER